MVGDSLVDWQHGSSDPAGIITGQMNHGLRNFLGLQPWPAHWIDPFKSIRDVVDRGMRQIWSKQLELCRIRGDHWSVHCAGRDDVDPDLMMREFIGQRLRHPDHPLFGGDVVSEIRHIDQRRGRTDHDDRSSVSPRQHMRHPAC